MACLESRSLSVAAAGSIYMASNPQASLDLQSGQSYQSPLPSKPAMIFPTNNSGSPLPSDLLFPEASVRELCQGRSTIKPLRRGASTDGLDLPEEPQAAMSVHACSKLTSGHMGVTGTDGDVSKITSGFQSDAGVDGVSSSAVHESKDSVSAVTNHSGHQKLKENLTEKLLPLENSPMENFQSAAQPTMANAVSKARGSPSGHQGSVPWRRTTTEPPMSPQASGQYTSGVTRTYSSISKCETSGSNPKREACPSRHLFSEGKKNSSRQERWAGPAYWSSPPPSSLPLPKRCLPRPKIARVSVALSVARTQQVSISGLVCDLVPPLVLPLKMELATRSLPRFLDSKS